MGLTLTNKHNLPQTFVNACLVDNHVTMGDISVTQLIDAPQVRILRKTNMIEEDVTDRIWAIMGTAVHHILELSEVKQVEAQKILNAAEVLMKHDQDKAAKFLYGFVKEYYPDAINKDILLEKTLSIEVDGMVISGTMDKFTISSGLLEDYKNVSTWAYIFEESKKKWYAQLNIYAHMLREHGYTVNKAVIVAIFRDFSAGKKYTKGYPQTPVAPIDIELYSHKQMNAYLRKRVALHKGAEFGNIPDCTSKEKWGTLNTYAVKATGRKNAIRVFPSEKLAQAFAQGDGSKYEGIFIETRFGEDKRCENYCAVKHICPQRKAKHKLMEEEEK